METPLSFAAITADAVASRSLHLCTILPGVKPAPMRIWHVEDPQKSLVHAPIWLAERDWIGIVSQHPLLDAVTGTESWEGGTLDGRERLRLAVMDLQLLGRAYWLCTPDRFGTPGTFWPISARKTAERRGADGLLEFYQYDHQPFPAGNSSTYIRLSKASVVRFKRAYLADPYSGATPVPPRDLAGLKITTKGLEQVANEFGVPIALLRPQHHTRAEVELATAQHELYAVDPILMLIAGCLTRWTHQHRWAENRGWDRLFWAFSR